ncbi:Hypothetical protein GbCGDNIH2_0812 [Granulibacter bethesdensis]|uniref:Uncharacterized protein n=1 Tax=Granulibacter bethesdensis (strain ATCC BAA-1260 / CGDNIH1) TaxID=391165 RepID=Q0BTZ2_GRABC|nr:Hypothetical protein GbCGDNIH1_0812 [Granulibacter bethesdensis CGDNIH1]APG30604.1 Hypothetical protein GbCGDNIH2_0812 [Granulibacter bethesdensis]APH51517.1 Hypothetical protein GbCGDNIH5_0812 [Granulibacter bethesdensis]APH64210.1 Hypothetical protein GbCGDNIH1I4_0812 [Granulibacter bethesdensis]
MAGPFSVYGKPYAIVADYAKIICLIAVYSSAACRTKLVLVQRSMCAFTPIPLQSRQHPSGAAS